MNLEEGWDYADNLLSQILLQTQELREKVDKMGALREGRPSRAFALQEVETAINELNEAARLSREARERLLKLWSNNGHSE